MDKTDFEHYILLNFPFVFDETTSKVSDYDENCTSYCFSRNGSILMYVTVVSDAMFTEVDVEFYFNENVETLFNSVKEFFHRFSTERIRYTVGSKKLSVVHNFNVPNYPFCLDVGIKFFEVFVKTYHTLRKNHIYSVGELLAFGDDLSQLSGIDTYTLEDIQNKIITQVKTC